MKKRISAVSLCRRIYDALFSLYGEVKCPLEYHTPFQLMAAVVLSAQCTDKRVNSVLPGLFAKYPDAAAFAFADSAELEAIIKPCGLYRTKAGNLIKTARILTDKYKGELPDTIDELTTLPGIGRKTANALIAHVFNGPGFAVDTHVNRLLNRIGIVKTHDPVKIEMRIKVLIPSGLLGNFSLLLITHGRICCKARKPHCPECKINSLCSKRGVGLQWQSKT